MKTSLVNKTTINAATSLPLPTDGDSGVALPNGGGNSAPSEALLRIKSTGDVTLSTSAGIYGYLDGAWSLISKLSSEEVALTSVIGADFRIAVLNNYERAMVADTGMSGSGTVTADLWEVASV